MNKDFKKVLKKLQDEGKYVVHSTSKFEDIPCLHMRACLMIDALSKIYGGNKKIVDVLFEQVNIDLKYGKYGTSMFKNTTIYRQLLCFYNEHKNAFRKKRILHVY